MVFLLRWVERTGAWIIEDDCQCEFTHEVRPVVPILSLDCSERVLYVGTFTNGMFLSRRLAYLVLSQAR